MSCPRCGSDAVEEDEIEEICYNGGRRTYYRAYCNSCGYSYETSTDEEGDFEDDDGW